MFIPLSSLVPKDVTEMSGREYGIRNRYGYLEFLDEDAIETVANFDGCVDVLGPAD